MPLPRSEGKSYAWPPIELTHIGPVMNSWSAWWTGNLDRLQEAYGGGTNPDTTGFFASDVGGFKPTLGQRVVRWFVGEPTRGPDRNTKLIIPIAAEIAQASADLLFGDPVKVKIHVGDTKERAIPEPVTIDPAAPPVKTSTRAPGQDRLDDLLNDKFHGTLAEGAEGAAALGGVFMRISWDDKLADRPFLTVRDADSALPKFSFGILTSVLFWDVVGVEKRKVYRLLENHEMNADGIGIVRYGLFCGEDDFLGDQVPLSTRDATAELSPLVNPALQMDGMDAILDTKSPKLAVVYVPNQTPNRLWRKDTLGRWLGRSDFDGIEHLMDELAECMSAWMRAIRLGKARILIGKELLNNAGPGNGQIANLEQEAYTTLKMLAGGKDQTLEQQIQMIQPQIPVQAHQTTAQALMEQILQMAGYSMQTFGVGDTGTVRTATEIESRERRSLLTRDRKIRIWIPAIRELVMKMIAIDNEFFHQSTKFDSISIAFTAGVQETELHLAQTAQAIFASESGSLERRVKLLNPDLDDDDLSYEIELARHEFAMMNATATVPGGTDPFGAPANPRGDPISTPDDRPDHTAGLS